MRRPQRVAVEVEETTVWTSRGEREGCARARTIADAHPKINYSTVTPRFRHLNCQVSDKLDGRKLTGGRRIQGCEGVVAETAKVRRYSTLGGSSNSVSNKPIRAHAAPTASAASAAKAAVAAAAAATMQNRSLQRLLVPR